MAREAALGGANLLVGLDGAVGVKEKHPYRAAVRPPVSIARSPYGQVVHAVAVQITHRGHG